MKRRTTHGVALCAMLVAGLTLAQSSQTTKTGLVITDHSFAPVEWTHGYVEHRFIIENPLPIRRTVTLELPGSTYSHARESLSLAATVTLEAGAKALLSMPQPPLQLEGRRELGLSMKGAKKEVLSHNAPHFNKYSSRGLPAILLSKSLSAEILKEHLLTNAVGSGTSSPSPARRSSRGHVTSETIFTQENMKELRLFRLERETSAWSPNWLAYTGFDACLITATDYAKMSTEVRTALMAFVAAGGQITFMGTRQIPEGWAGFGENAKAVVTKEGIVETRYGFGIVQALEADDVKKLTPKQLTVLVHTWAARKECQVNPQRHYSRYGSGSGPDCAKQIPMTIGLHVPINLFLTILLGFALIAGPGAVIYTGRTNRRIWLLWLVPALSITFSVAIFVFALLSEGITPSVHCQAVTLLDQKQHQAVTLGAVGVYAPLSLSDGLQFDRGTEVTPLSLSEQGTAQLVWGQRQHFAAGWVLPRMPAYFRLRRSEARSERLLVTEQADNGVEVVNMLGVPIRRLLVCDSQSRTYEAIDLRPGEKRALAPKGKEKKSSSVALDKLRDTCLTDDAGWNIESHTKHWGDKTLPNPSEMAQSSYVAVLDGSPFIENPLSYGSFKGTSTALVLGSF